MRVSWHRFTTCRLMLVVAVAAVVLAIYAWIEAEVRRSLSIYDRKSWRAGGESLRPKATDHPGG